MQEMLVINGGNRLQGEIRVDTAKNAVLPIIAGCILTDGEVILNEIPIISDVKKMLDMLTLMGAAIKTDERERCAYICTKNLNTTTIPTELAKEIRSSIFMLGPLLAKHKNIPRRVRYRESPY